MSETDDRHYRFVYPEPGPFRSVEEIRRRNLGSRQHWFSPGALRFFDSEVGTEVVDGRLFISSERFVGSDGIPDPRRYTVRVADDDGTVSTLGGFGAFATEHRALEEARRLAGLREQQEATG